MKQIIFKDFIFKKFQEWEYDQPNHRSSFTAFSKWLSTNSYKIIFKQQLISDWIKGKYKPSEEKYLLALEEKLGKEIYEVLNTPRPDPRYQYVKSHWNNLPPEEQERISKIIAKYTTDPFPNDTEKQPAPKS
jgi:hypothetical protein